MSDHQQLAGFPNPENADKYHDRQTGFGMARTFGEAVRAKREIAAVGLNNRAESMIAQ
jgi:hypothetical protein